MRQAFARLDGARTPGIVQGHVVAGRRPEFRILRIDYRLIVRVHYERGIVYVWNVLTHADYTKLDLKKIDQKIEREKRGRH